ncbi:D-2-hydroxyacid dehydrogenase family protein [Agromyces aerolatus]|uniref:D-2-hydroxyacid dehydrogenase family protein n=1 Tax=Agromyces sp. LY-1074 TaxID=3074080 RepID=UPI00285EF666|nr:MULTISPECIES: D-2-hydroxyacid dehydrogenase family protein [unclassified Agromyces]MDR5700913.1 D-2-hydroxyacid dehydrogenase family protein [Agromyces sp. LY-1074]MDR5707426.1 D-2-hydroxyacid dehydrogenase family protein [Agromyces sp. LY-1358]
MDASGARTRVAILDDYQSAALDAADWSRLDADVVTFRDPLPDAASVVAALRGFDVVVAMRERTAFPEQVLAGLADLRLLVTTGMRNAAIDVAAARRLGITVCGTRGHAGPTVELTWALILGLVREVAADDAAVRAGAWQTRVPGDLEGRTLGIVGLGRLGARVAAVGRAFGMSVIAWSPNLTEDRARAADAVAVEKAELFSRADIVSLHLALSDSTRGIVGADDLRRMSRHAILVNTARGPLVDEVALCRAVEERWIDGVGLDVYDHEPVPRDHWLRRADASTGARVLRSPHMGFVTRGNYRTFYGDAVEDIAAFFAGRPIRELDGEA